MRAPVIAGNWKCHTTAKEAAALIIQLARALDGVQGVEVIVCPPFTALPAAAAALAGTAIGLGAQDVFWEPQGAFTGEISAPMLVDAGCRHVIIGHSERRTHFGETDETVQRKLRAALAQGLTPIVCIGETLAQRTAEETFDVLARQLDGALGGCPEETCRRLILAYEPVWAIGTGLNATPKQAQEVHAKIRDWLKGRFAPAAAQAIRIQYGGSVTAANAADLLRQPDVDGALVGGASLKPDAFCAIVHAAVEAKAAARGQGAG